MAAGLRRSMLVLGLVIWLATVGIFKNPVTVAVCLGLGNGLILVLGWLVTARTRYQMAGRALTLLACLVMPLNLWFYHAQGLITIEGNLWAPALVCCVLYAASALVLRDRTFVYVLAGGVAMTGLLILADMHKFFEIAAPAHAAWSFSGSSVCTWKGRFPTSIAPSRGGGSAWPFSGRARRCWPSGCCWCWGPKSPATGSTSRSSSSFIGSGTLGPPAIVAEHWGQLLALALVVAATYAYVYSDLVVRRVGVYIYLAVFTLLWAEVLIINQFPLHQHDRGGDHRPGADGATVERDRPDGDPLAGSRAPGEAADSALLSARPLAPGRPWA